MNSHALSGSRRGKGARGGRATLQPGTKTTEQRRDIQGLRALAVVAVILNHLFDKPVGGFVGVDVFFVISGFLISGLLVREVTANGRINFAAFYARRARRILPIAVLVVVVTVAAAYLLYNSGRGGSVRTDGIFAVLFAANWHFAAVGTDYWQTDGLVSPLQHYWSLAVEEQFYLFWPWLIIGAAWLGMKTRARSAVVVTAGFMGVIAAASFAYALWQVETAPTWAYFSTFTRTWELAAGALVALALPRLGRLPGKVRDVMAATGLAVIIASVFLVHPDSGIPAPGAVFPVLGAALLIAGGTGRNSRIMVPLTNPAAQYIGRISYSLYLWHFPVIILLRAFLPDGGAGYAFTALVLMTVLSVMSFHLVEDPIRRSNLFGRSGSGTATAPGRKLAHRWNSPRWKPFALAAQGVATAVLAIVLLLNPAGPGAPTQAGEPNATASGTPAGEPARDTAPSPEDEIAASVSAALAMGEFPEVSPGIDTLGTSAWIDEVNSDGCAEISEANLAECSAGPAEPAKTVAVLGDSYAIAWLPGLRAAAESLNYRLVPLTKGQCPAASVSVTRDGGTDFPECDEHREWALEQIARLKPDLLILADADNTLARLASGAAGGGVAPEGTAEVEDGLSETIIAVQDSVGEVAVLAPPPAGRNLQECVSRVGAPDDCTSSISDQWQAMRQVQESAAAGAGARYVATDRWFCDASGKCPGIVGTTPVRADTSHLTTAYSRSLAPVLAGVMSG